VATIDQHVASCASITAPRRLPRNQETTGFSHLPSFDDETEERSVARGTLGRDVGTTTDTPLDRVAERQRAVALARHFREVEGLSIAQIAARLGRAPTTVKGYFYDPSGEKARAVKARYQGVCRGCGAPTQPRNGKGDAYEYCKCCHPGAAARTLTREAVREAMRRWRSLYGAAPSSYDWSRTHARERGKEAVARLGAGDWPPPATVIDLYGSWAAARADALADD
jgi:hypothetical protein